MTEKELKKLNRKQLLELLLVQTERINRLQKQLETAEEKLAERIIAERDAGSIAEAALKLNGVFEAAQAAADQYIENIKSISERLEEKERRLSSIPDFSEERFKLSDKKFENSEKDLPVDDESFKFEIPNGENHD
ncbi:MAG: hypothetical protein IJO64_08090 [Clostridia bacterium]|nr:hypothetical protein [Clostridia bacterium]MBQ9849000.1 hypothetical protein [Clostridia bacterium]